MGRPAAWVIIGATVAVLVAGVLTVANYRFVVAPVDPPRPLPDYAVQTAVAWITVAAVGIVGIVVGAVAGRRVQGRAAAVGQGVAALVALALAGAIAAFVLSAP